MKEEIKDLRRRIKELDHQIAGLQPVSDSVTCGKRGKKPLVTAKITGFPYPEYNRKKSLLIARKRKLERLEVQLLELMGQVEEYIESIEQSELRIMFRLYYVDELTWLQVAFRMNRMFPRRRIPFTEDSCRIRHNRYLEKIE